MYDSSKKSKQNQNSYWEQKSIKHIAVRTKKTKQCTITIGSGDWGKNTILSAAPMIAFPVVGFINFMNSAISSKISESDLWYYIESIANKDFYKNK